VVAKLLGPLHVRSYRCLPWSYSYSCTCTCSHSCSSSCDLHEPSEFPSFDIDYWRVGPIFALFKMGGRRTATQLGLAFRQHGGRRPGAGRKPRPGRRNVLHRARERFASRHPLLVTLRADATVGSLRAKHTFREVRASIAAAAQRRAGFRIVQFSVQRDHIHLIVEAKDRATLSLAMRGLGVRLCKAINRAIGRPRGRVFLDRYHDRILRTPREVRNAIAYVLQNARKHGVAPRSASRGWVDPMSSGPWFDGWRGKVVIPQGAVRTTGPPDESPVGEPRTWLLRTGWRRYGRIDPWREQARPPAM
jgi:REP element-mobilizing transposase RayT